MEGNPPRVSRNKESHDHEASSRGGGGGGGGPTRSRNRSRFAVDESGDLIECSGKYCRSCTAGVVADCVALCCCPCVVLHCFALAFVKAPWMVGRRCLGLGKKKKKTGQRHEQNDGVLERNTDGNLRKGWVQEGMLEMVSGFGEAEKMGSVSASFEADKVWIELYQIGHLGFGRLSFTHES